MATRWHDEDLIGLDSPISVSDDFGVPDGIHADWDPALQGVFVDWLPIVDGINPDIFIEGDLDTGGTQASPGIRAVLGNVGDILVGRDAIDNYFRVISDPSTKLTK